MAEQKQVLLFTVEDRFQIKDRGVIAVPGPSVDLFLGRRLPIVCQVILKAPDGTTHIVEARFFNPFFEPLAAQLKWIEQRRLECLLKNITADMVPVGTEIWSYMK